MPNIQHIMANSSFTLLTSIYTTNNIFTQVYATDLISMVIKHSKSEPILITQIDADATLAVAMMLNLPAIILTESKRFPESLIKRANEENIAVLTTTLTAVDTIIILERMKLL